MSVNDELLSASIAHQIELHRYSNGAVRKMIALLNKVDADLFIKLQAALDKLPPEKFTVKRLDAVLASVREVNTQAFAQVSDEFKIDMKDLVDYEAGYQHSLFDHVIPVDLSLATVSVEQVYSAAMAAPFQGKLLNEVLSDVEAARATRIRDAIRIGYVENQTIQQMVQRIKGTRALRYADGLLQTDRRNVEAIVRTAVNHTANYTRDMFYEKNVDVIKGLRWTSTIDGRTSAICQSRDGQIYQVDKGPRPPAHFNCRSVMTAVLKSWKDLGYDLNELPASTRASMDGQIPADTTYQEWLSKKPAAFQDDILGKTKGELFRKGDVSLDRFVDTNGKAYSLQELRKLNADAFKKAGL